MKQLKKQHFGIYWLPNSLTILALTSGLYAIISGFQGDFEKACILLIIASILDVLDGFVAKLTNSTSEFGAQLDSLSDIISFGAAPAILTWLWSYQVLGNTASLAVFIFTAMTALRLARFNTQLSDKESKPYFQGLPSPAAASTLFTLIYLAETYSISITLVSWALFFTSILSALLMVSNIRYPGIKHLGKKRIPFIGLLALFVIFVVIISQPQLILWILSTGYAIFGLVYTLVLRRQRRNKRQLKNSTKNLS